MSTADVVLVALAATVLIALAPAASRAFRHRVQGAPSAVIVDSWSATAHDCTTGAGQSAQTAEVVMPVAALEAIWSAANLERLARPHRRFLSSVTLGRVHAPYSHGGRAIVLSAPPITLSSFPPPECEVDPGCGIVRWRIAG